MAIRKRTWTAGGKEKSAWVVHYRDGAGDRRQKTFPTKREATEWAAETHVDVKRGLHTPESTSKTVAAAADLWLDTCRNGTDEIEPLERSTIREYEACVRYLCDAEIGIGQIKLFRLDIPLVREFSDRLLASGKSRALVRKVRTALSALLSDAQERRLVTRHVLREQSRKHRTNRDHKEIEIPSKADLRLMLDRASDYFRPFLVTAMFTGLRASELRGLTWDRVDFDAGVIQVRQRADRWNQMGPPKTHSSNRDLPMAPIVISSLRPWRLRCPNGPLNLVFPTKRGSIWHHSNLVRLHYASLQRACGLVNGQGRAQFGLHALRHVAASLFIEEGFTPKRVQALMGHSSITVTYDTYGHLFPSPDDDRQAMANIQARILG